MALPGTAGYMPQHSDVLSATPSGPDDVKKLVEELRRRGNAAFKSQSFYEAETLYSKAIEHDPVSDAALYGNRSAARLGMKKFADALTDADQAVKMGWAKGHFRRGQALCGLNKWRDAQKAFEMCASLDESNKDAKKEAEKAKEKADEEEGKMDIVIEDTTDSKNSLNGEKSTSKKTRSKKSASSSKSSSPEGDDDADVDPSQMRGYKTLDDGRKTTFFHREIDPEEKRKLAEANKPKAITSPAQAPALNGKDGSVWNAAGTFEEKDMTKWATDKIKELVKGVSTVFEGTGDTSGIVEATNISDLDGVASVSFIRGTRKFPFDFTFNVDWTATISEGEFSGKLFFSQFNSDESDIEAEVRWENRDKAGAAAKPLMEHLKKDFRQEVESKLKMFITEFQKL